MASACFTAARMPKSPQPGHQVDFSVLLKSLTSSMYLDLRAGFASHAGDDLVCRDRASVVFQNRLVHGLASVGAQHIAELAGEVLLDEHEGLRLVEQGAHAGPVERPHFHEMEQVRARSV